MTGSPASNPSRLVALCWLATISSNPLLPTRNALSPSGTAAKVLAHESLLPFFKCKYKFFAGYLIAEASGGCTEIQGVNTSESRLSWNLPILVSILPNRSANKHSPRKTPTVGLSNRGRGSRAGFVIPGPNSADGTPLAT